MVKSKHRRFSNEEDKKLKELVNKHGDKDWIIISSYMPGRNSRQCRERWNNYLSPKINRREFTIEEDQIILSKFNEYGSRWAVIANFLEKRTDQMVKNRFFVLKRHVVDENEIKKDNLESTKICKENNITFNNSFETETDLNVEKDLEKGSEDNLFFNLDDIRFSDDENQEFYHFFDQVAIEIGGIFDDLN